MGLTCVYLLGTAIVIAVLAALISGVRARERSRRIRALIELTANPPLVLLMGMLTHIYESHVSTAAIAANVEKVHAASKQRGVQAHEKLLALIEAGDADGAEVFWRKHLEGIDKYIRETYPVETAIDLLD